MKPLLLAGGALVALMLSAPVRVATPAAGDATLAWPVAHAVQTQAFGCTGFTLEPADPLCPSGHFHSGIDLAAPLGTPVLAAAAGSVEVVHSLDGYGLHVMLAHSAELLTLYGHLDSVAVRDGELVGAGQLVGRLGSSGFSTGPHLHFEVRRDGRPVDPRPWLPAPTKGGN